jgi:uncharacterized protein YjbI with pentapeptide repeats
MNDSTPRASRRVRFEEVTPAHEYAAFLTVSIAPLVAHLGLPIFDGYDDLDDLQLAFLTLPSGETVTLGEYAGAPGTSIYIEMTMQNIPQIVFDSCQQLRVSRQEVEWFHPDWQAEIDRLYAEHGGIEEIERNSILAALSQNNESEPIDCFYHALEIYTREKLPEYWAMLQHNLGLAYFDRRKGARWENLQKSIECYHNSLEVFTQDKFPKKWQINQEDLKQSRKVWEVEKQNLAKDIFARQIPYRQLKGVDLSLIYMDGRTKIFHLPYNEHHVPHTEYMEPAYLMGADLRQANFAHTRLHYANLSNADLSESNLLNAILDGANLIEANLSHAKLVCTSLIDTKFNRAKLCHTDLRGAKLTLANLLDTNLSHANLSGADLTRSNLSNADLSNADLSNAKLMLANLSGTNLSGADVNYTQFGNNVGISESMRLDLISRGAIFEDSPGDRSNSRTLASR